MAYSAPVDQGFIDADLYFATAQSIPTDGADDLSENEIDLVAAAPNIGAGTPGFVKIKVTTAIAVAGGTSSWLDIELCTHATAGTTIGATTKIAHIGSLDYAVAAGTVLSFPIPQHAEQAYLRYLALALSPRGDDTLFSGGAVDAWLDYN